MLGAVTSIASTVASGVHISFKTPSDKRAAKVLPSVVQSALSGNLTALKCLDERRGPPGPPTQVGVAAERAVWAGGYNQVVTQRPDLLALYQANKAKIPAVNHSSPEAAAQSALANPYTAGATSGTATAPVVTLSPDLSAKAAAAFNSTPLWLVLVLAGGAGYYIYKASRK